MKLKHYLSDRWAYIVLFLGSTLLTVAVVQLDLARQGASLRFGNAAYAGVLAAALLLCWLVADYARQRAYYRELARVLAEPERLDAALLLRSGATTEQRLVQRALERMHGVYADELTKYRLQQERNLHQLQRWAHQMKTPVAVIDLLTQRRDEAEGGTAVLDSIREETERIHGHIAMMLEAARLESFERDVRIRRVDATAMMRGLVNELRSAWIRSGVFPKLVADGDEPVRVETDEKWASFVCRQLLSNALKYSAAARRAAHPGHPAPPDPESSAAGGGAEAAADSGSIRASGASGEPGAEAGDGGAIPAAPKQVVIEVRRTREGAVVRVTDEGVGIPPEDLPRVFEPFFTGANGRLVPESTGMGLYLAKEACDRLGHRLTARSVPGAGASFELLFPTSGALFREPLGR